MANVFVCVRFRPSNGREQKNKDPDCIIKEEGNESTCLKLKDDKVGEVAFQFDKIFWPGASQAEVYQVVAEPIVKDVLQGVNGTILAYGQTSAGKTHSMEGPALLTCDRAERGILPRVAEAIFAFIKSADPAYEFLVKVSVVELYMEKLRDLLQTEKDNLSIRESAERGIWVADATEVYVQEEQQMLQVLQAGVENRAIASTQMNNQSSRSHCIYLLQIIATHVEDRSIRSGKLHLVDLAGSEKVDKTGAEGQVLSEAKMINKSLSALGNVINGLTDEKASFIPYRDSKLTRVLQESLGGNSRTVLLCCCSPSSSNAQETLSTLRFGFRAKQVKNQPKVNTERSRAELERLLERTEKERDGLKQQLDFLTLQIKLDPARDASLAKEASLVTGSDSAEILHLKGKVLILELYLSRMKNQALQELSKIEPRLSNGADDVFDRLLKALPSTDQQYAESEGEQRESPDSTAFSLHERMERLAISYAQALRQNKQLRDEKRALERMMKLCENKATSDKTTQQPRILRPLRGGSDTEPRTSHSIGTGQSAQRSQFLSFSPAEVWSNIWGRNSSN